MDARLTPPARYFPLANGRYEVKPGLSRFGTNFGNSAADRRVFQIDDQFAQYRAGKLAARVERLGKYFATHELKPAVAAVVTGFLAERLVTDYPDLFTRQGDRLRCALTDETVDAGDLDALAGQIQEDFAVLEMEGDRHWLAAIYLSFPNHWAAEEKVGHSFAEVHAPVAGMEQMNRQSEKFARVMIDATDGLVRFAWGIGTDDRLNHHPEPPPGADPVTWRGRQFERHSPRAFLRVERQTIWGFPDVGASLFTIRTYFIDVADVKRNPTECAALVSAIESMSPATLRYKGLAEWRDDLLDWLRA